MEFCTFKVEGEWCSVVTCTMDDGIFFTDGFIGENTYNGFKELLEGLQGHGINIDDIFFT